VEDIQSFQTKFAPRGSNIWSTWTFTLAPRNELWNESPRKPPIHRLGDQIHISSSWLPTTLLSQSTSSITKRPPRSSIISRPPGSNPILGGVRGFPIINRLSNDSTWFYKVHSNFSSIWFLGIISWSCYISSFRYFALHAFFGMLAQAPLVAFSKYIDRRFDNPVLGNVMFWLTFCVIGQPMGVIMYYYDFWRISQ